MTTNERDAFEKWLLDSNKAHPKSAWAAAAWEAWQARAVLDQRQGCSTLSTTLNGKHVGVHGSKESIEVLDEYLDQCQGGVVTAEMVSVTKTDANNYCQILSLLGMEEEGDPVEWVKSTLAIIHERNDKQAALQSIALPVKVPDNRDVEIARLNAIINTPQSDDFLRAVSIEAEHQCQRWGNDHDAGKTPADWYWLVGYLAGKALHAHIEGNIEKAEHHMITAAAACENWQRALLGRTNMRPGIDGEAMLFASPKAQKAGDEGWIIKLTAIDEYGPQLEWSKPWTDFPVGKTFK